MTFRLRELRKARRWTQAELASMLGISMSHVSEMEQGKKNPSRPLLQQLADIFKVPIADMYELEVDEPSIHALVKQYVSLSASDQKVVADLVAALHQKQDAK